MTLFITCSTTPMSKVNDSKENKTVLLPKIIFPWKLVYWGSMVPKLFKCGLKSHKTLIKNKCTRWLPFKTLTGFFRRLMNSPRQWSVVEPAQTSVLLHLIHLPPGGRKICLVNYNLISNITLCKFSIRSIYYMFGDIVRMDSTLVCLSKVSSTQPCHTNCLTLFNCIFETGPQP